MLDLMTALIMRQQLVPVHPQVGQRKQRNDLRCILL